VEVGTWLEDPSAEIFTVGLGLVRRFRDPAFVPLLERVHELLPEPARRPVRLLLLWLYSAPGDVIPDAARRAFAERVARWVDEAPDAEAATLAPGLLDLVVAGAEAYARGLGGPRRAAWIGGLLSVSRLVPLVVAQALLAPVSGATSPEERRAVLVATYRAAPTEAAPDLAAARARLAPEVRHEADDVLEAVRHRAPLPAAEAGAGG
jgi:hypothetical protein